MHWTKKVLLNLRLLILLLNFNFVVKPKSHIQSLKSKGGWYYNPIGHIPPLSLIPCHDFLTPIQGKNENVNIFIQFFVLLQTCGDPVLNELIN